MAGVPLFDPGQRSNAFLGFFQHGLELGCVDFRLFDLFIQLGVFIGFAINSDLQCEKLRFPAIFKENNSHNAHE